MQNSASWSSWTARCGVPARSDRAPCTLSGRAMRGKKKESIHRSNRSRTQRVASRWVLLETPQPTAACKVFWCPHGKIPRSCSGRSILTGEGECRVSRVHSQLAKLAACLRAHRSVLHFSDLGARSFFRPPCTLVMHIGASRMCTNLHTIKTCSEQCICDQPSGSATTKPCRESKRRNPSDS